MIYLPAHIANTIKLAIRKIDFTVGFIFLIIHIETKAITNTGNIAILKKEVVNEINKNKTKFMKDFSFKSNHTTELKLKVLGIIMSMDTSARMIGNYTGPHLELYTEKVTGTTTACLGLIQSKDCYIPNSVLSEDIRSIVPKPPGKIFAIFKKPIGAPLYTQLTYKSKNISITKKCLPKELLTEVDTSLLEDNNNSDDNEPA